MSRKIVVYNGGTYSYSGSSDPKVLVRGKKYEVIEQNVRAWQTDYMLQGVKGNFNSVWFDDVKSGENTFMALAHVVPIVGKRLQCSKIEFLNGQPKLTSWSTSTVKEVSTIGKNIYNVTTCNSVYIVQVG